MTKSGVTKLGTHNILIYRTVLQKPGMSAQSCDFPVIQHQDLIRVKNGAYTLGDDDDSRIFRGIL